VNVWALSRVVLVNMHCRPDAFAAAAATVTAAAVPEAQPFVQEALEGLAAVAAELQVDATSTSAKDAFSRQFHKFVRLCHGKL
jgi:hypothetical protein